MKPVSCNQEMGDTKRILCPGAPQSPAGYHHQFLFNREYFILSLKELLKINTLNLTPESLTI